MSDQGRDMTIGAVELTYRPRHGDIVAGIAVRDRKRGLVFVRWAFTLLFAALGVRTLVVYESSVLSAGVAFFCAALIWSMPHLQAHHVIRTVEWQGDYRTAVSAAGISTATDHCVLTQYWTMFRGYRETRDHFVLLSRDRNILCVEVLPKRSLSAPQDADRLRALLDRHTASAGTR
ncbi:YcxB family protein [Streptomyces sp. TRM66268-LWL]|uniref:YcxB family protein n=1 Tax=Streptomyces polyasparticus TaxID=2767826 RepID=A0ABR7SL22_9ACTN|nr:YcxB family protein [Streptomyces polyasparticus]MBC9716176.1 YcxB family protein [Streptomyces polyasparticus]